MRRYARVTLTDGRVLTHAVFCGASNAGPGLEFGIQHSQGGDWIAESDIAEIVFDACGKCGRPVVEDGVTHRGEPWHLDCWTALDPHA